MRSIGLHLRPGRPAAGFAIALVVGAVVAVTLGAGIHPRDHPTPPANAGSSEATTPAVASVTPPSGWPATPPVGSPTPVAPPAAASSGIPLSAGPCGGPLAFVDRLHGWLTVPTGGTTSQILSTDDGGTSWVVQLLAPFWVGELDFVSAADGWALAGASETAAPEPGGLLRTIDGGATWTALDVPGEPLACVDFVSSSAGWGLAEMGQMLATTDGGVSWSSASVGAGLAVEAVCFSDASQGWAVAGTTLGAPMGIYGTGDGGASWALQYSASWIGTWTYPVAVTCSGSAVWVRVPLGAGAGNLYTEYAHTQDGGAHWTPSPSPAPTGEDFDGMDGPVAIVGGTVLIASAEVPAPPGLETVSASGVPSGRAWLPIPSGAPWGGDADSAAGMSFVDPRHGWLLISTPLIAATAAASSEPSPGASLTGGGGGFLDAVYATADGGATWTHQANYSYTLPAPDGAGGVGAPAINASEQVG